MRVLGLDIGSARIGVAVSDPDRRVATPLVVLDARQLTADVGRLATIIDDYEADLLVVGLPLTLAGEEGPQAAEVRTVAERLSAVTGVPVVFSDERHSTTEAKRTLRERGLSERDQRGRVDMIAASLMLQAWLDARRAGEER